MGIPLVALQRQPQPMPFEQAGQLLGIRNAEQQGQLQQQQIRQNEYQFGATQAMNKAYQGAVKIDENGQPQFDTNALTKSLSDAGYGSEVPTILKHVTDFQQSQATLQKTATDTAKAQQEMRVQQADMMGSVGAAIKAANYDPALADTFLQHYESQPQLPPQEKQYIDQLRSQVSQNPQMVKQIADRLIAGSPKQQQMANERQIADIRATGGAENRELNAALQSGAINNESEWPAYKAKQEAQNRIATENSPEAIAGAAAKAGAEAKARLPYSPPVVVNQMQNATGAGKPSADVAKQFGMTPEAFDQAAEKYYQTGNLPPIGRGAAGPALQKAIMNRTGELHPGASLAEGSAEYKANADSLKALQGNLDSVSAFENTANKNLNMFTSLAKKAIDTGIPLLNAPLRSGAKLLNGSEDQLALDAARQVAVNEIAKVTSNPGLKGQLSDTARKEVDAFIPANATYGQALRVAQVLQQDMANRHQSYQQQIEDIKGRMKGRTSPMPTGDASGMIYARDPKGKLHSAKAGTALPTGWTQEKAPQ